MGSCLRFAPSSILRILSSPPILPLIGHVLRPSFFCSFLALVVQWFREANGDHIGAAFALPVHPLYASTSQFRLEKHKCLPSPCSKKDSSFVLLSVHFGNTSGRPDSKC